MDDIPAKENVLVSRYIAHPLLLDGKKFDLRIFVAITSVEPLRIYVHEHGIMRICSEKYTLDEKELQNKFVHLTNYAIQKRHKSFSSNVTVGRQTDAIKASFVSLHCPCISR